MDHILEPHQATMVERCQHEEIVLAIQDTTLLDYYRLQATGGLVGIGDSKEVRGLWAHVGLAINPAGRPFGVFSLDATYGDGEQDGEHECALSSVGSTGRRNRPAPARRRGWSPSVTEMPTSAALFVKAASPGAALLVRARRSTQRSIVVETGGKQDL